MTAPAAGAPPPRPSLFVRALRTLLRALLLAFAIGFGVGTLIRCEAERRATPPLQYLGLQSPWLQSPDDRKAPSPARESARPA